MPGPSTPTAANGPQPARAVATSSDRPEVQIATTDTDGARCGDDTVLEIDVAHARSREPLACASVDVDGFDDRLVQNIARDRRRLRLRVRCWRGQHSNVIDDEGRLGQLKASIVFPA